jgi:hypothetical protein
MILQVSCGYRAFLLTIGEELRKYLLIGRRSRLGIQNIIQDNTCLVGIQVTGFARIVKERKLRCAEKVVRTGV